MTDGTGSTDGTASPSNTGNTGNTVAPSTYVPPPPYARPPDHAAAPIPYPGYAYPPPPPGYAYGYPPPRPQAPRPPLALGRVGAGLAGAGALLVAIALLVLPWFSVGGGLTVSDVRGLLEARADLANDLSVAYFSWFGWVLVLLTAGCAAASVLPRYELSLAFRIAGPIAAGFAVLFTLGSVELTDARFGGDEDTYYFHHLAAGFWCALLGFTLIGAGSIIGPRVDRSDATFQK